MRRGERQDDDAPPLRDAARGVRLQRAMADAGVGSRRRCEELIEEGVVRVNDRLVRELPAWVDPSEDLITVAGRELPRAERKIYVLLHKPRHTVSAVSDPGGRRTVAELVKHPSGARLYPVGRLDYDTMGLLLLTNDGGLANRLTHPRYGVHKTYRAIVKGVIDDDELERLRRGVFLAHRKEGQTVGAERTGPAQLRVVRRERERTVLDIILREGRNRQVRRMLADVGHRVRKLTRIEMGPLKLKGVRLGEWRELTPGELGALRLAAVRGKTKSGTAAGAARAAKSRRSRERSPRTGRSARR